MGIVLEPVDRGDVVRLAPSPGRDRVADTLGEFHSAAARGAEAPLSLVQSLVGEMAGAPAAPADGLLFRPSKRNVSRVVVHRWIDYAESIQRTPALQELCVVARTSERRLRHAFAQEFDQPRRCSSGAGR